jgi:hypothetical protein
MSKETPFGERDLQREQKANYLYFALKESSHTATLDTRT